MDVNAYLERMGYRGSLEPTVDTLRELQRAHMFNVPFENLDIHNGRFFQIDIPSIYEKIVLRNRGGFCYELNGLFSWLLREMGFDMTLLAGRVFMDGELGLEFGHMNMLIQLEERWLADVGFGDSFVEPLRLDENGEQSQFGRSYQISSSGKEYTLLLKDPDTEWEPQYVFTLAPHELREWDEMNVWQQTSPDSFFTKKRVCSLATEKGRITLRHTRLLITENFERQVIKVRDKEEYNRLLREIFGIVLDEGEQILPESIS
jgi:N-hydroxyarylamine O-acetyltransferase